MDKTEKRTTVSGDRGGQTRKIVEHDIKLKGVARPRREVKDSNADGCVRSSPYLTFLSSSGLEAKFWVGIVALVLKLQLALNQLIALPGI